MAQRQRPVRLSGRVAPTLVAGALAARALAGCGEQFRAQPTVGDASAGTGASGGTRAETGGAGGSAAGTGATGGAGNGEAGQGQGGQAGACQLQTQTLVAIDAVSLDYGSEPRDEPGSDPLILSTGQSHDHVHDFVAWLKFNLREIRRDAVPTALTLKVYCLSVEGTRPPLGVLYSSGDAWTAATATTDTADVIPRTKAVGGGDALEIGAIELTIDLDTYGTYWANDLADGAVTLGVTIATSTLDPEVWGTLAARGLVGIEPVLELVTCE